VLDSYAYYYYVHSLSMAALDFSKRAIAIYDRLGKVEGIIYQYSFVGYLCTVWYVQDQRLDTSTLLRCSVS
jgi:hypothetical protein